MTSARRQQIMESLKDKAYRDLYVLANIRNGIAFQIRAMRQSRGWTQSELGLRTGKAQEVISKLEDPDYGRVTLQTLCRLASAFDVALIVKFAPFSHLVDELATLSPSDLAVPGFEDHPRLTEESPSILLPQANTHVQPIGNESTGPTELLSTGNITDITEFRQRQTWRDSDYLESVRTAEE